MDFLKKLISCQAFARRYISNKTNLLKTVQKRGVKRTFKQEIQGYHLINEEPLKESRWEEINRNILSRYVSIGAGAYGNHTSGIDNSFNGQGVSNKSCKLYKTRNKTTIQVSSYCLSSVCSESNPNTIQEIIKEIERRDMSYQYYSLLLRDETEEDITYLWYMVPKDYYVFNVNKFFWIPMMGRAKKTKGRQLGWHSTNARICFSIGSKLWFNFEQNEIEQFEVTRTTVQRELPIMNYRQLYKWYKKQRIF